MTCSKDNIDWANKPDETVTTTYSKRALLIHANSPMTRVATFKNQATNHEKESPENKRAEIKIDNGSSEQPSYKSSNV